MDNSKELTHISLCAGYGGIDIGFKRVLRGVRTIAFSEIEAYAITNLIEKMEAGLLDPAPVWTDLKTFPYTQFHGKVDILSGGFPCQPFSNSGKRGADSDPRHLFPYIKRGIEQCRPAIVYLENVEGIISAKLKGDDWADPEGTPVLLHVLRELERVGYEATAGVFSAAEIGAPHQRKRVFILGISTDLPQCQRARVSTMLVTAQPVAIAYPARRNQEQHGFEPARVIIEGQEHTPALKRVSIVHNADCARSSRDQHESTDCAAQRRQGPIRHIAASTPSPDGVHGAGQPALDRSTYGLASRLDNAHVQDTCASDQLGHTHNARSQRNSDAHAVQGGATSQLDHTSTSSDDRLARAGQPALDRNTYGLASGLDYGQLCNAYDSPVDEMRLLGNGVVPDVAARAFAVMWRELNVGCVDRD